MWESGKNYNGHRKVNNIEAGVNQVSEAKPQPRHFEALGPAKGTSRGPNRLKVCRICRSHNPVHTTAVKPMTCVIDFYNLCGKRGHTMDRCFNNPDSPWLRPQASGQAQQQPKPAVNAIISDHNTTRPQLCIEQGERSL